MKNLRKNKKIKISELLLIISIFLVLSCDYRDSKLDQIEVKDLDNFENVMIEGSELPTDPFGFTVNETSLQKKFLKEVKTSFEIRENAWVKGKLDTIFTFMICNSYIKTYSLQDKVIVLDALVRDACISLNKQIKVGMTKQKIISIIPKLKNLNSDKISISDESGLSTIYLTFRNNHLIKIFIVSDIEY